MITYRLYHPIYFLLAFISFSSCNGQTKTDLPTDNTKQQTIKDEGLGLPKTSAEMKSFLDAGIDPYFVETRDTFSTHGPQCIVRNLIQDKAGNIWLATWHGIIKYDGKIFTNYTLKENLIRFHVVTLFEDSHGNIWFGTARGGVYYHDPSATPSTGEKSFTLFTTKDGLPDNTVNCIAEDKEGNIWFGTEQGASRYNPSASLKSGEKNFMNFSTKEGLSDNYVNAILSDKTGKMWFGTNNGINHYDGKSFTKFTDNSGQSFKQVISLFEDREGNIWIGSGAKEAGGKGLCCYNGKSVNESISPYFVMYMCQDKKGNLWIAHNKGADHVNFALYSYAPSATLSTGEKLFAKIIEQDKPDNPVIFGIIEDKNENIWFGTAKGVCRYDRKSFNYFTE